MSILCYFFAGRFLFINSVNHVKISHSTVVSPNCYPICLHDNHFSKHQLSVFLCIFEDLKLHSKGSKKTVRPGQALYTPTDQDDLASVYIGDMPRFSLPFRRPNILCGRLSHIKYLKDLTNPLYHFHCTGSKLQAALQTMDFK